MTEQIMISRCPIDRRFICRHPEYYIARPIQCYTRCTVGRNVGIRLSKRVDRLRRFEYVYMHNMERAEELLEGFETV